jgi:hypothetical protein
MIFLCQQITQGNEFIFNPVECSPKILTIFLPQDLFPQKQKT